GSAWQRWVLQTSSGASSAVQNSSAEGYWVLKNASSGKCVEINSHSTENGGRAQQWVYYGSSSQEWSFQAVGNGSYAIINRNSGLALDVTDRSTADGAPLQQWSNQGGTGTNQTWKFYEVPTPPKDLVSTFGNGTIALK